MVLLLLHVGLSATPAAGQSGELERGVKAAFLYKFGAYVEWPESAFPFATTPVRIGVLGDDLLAAELASIVNGRTIDGRNVFAVNLSDVDSLTDVHILFVGRSRMQDLRSLERSGDPILVVTESDEGLRNGAVVDFVLIDGRVRFDISLDSAETRGLVLSSRLLAIANSVFKRRP